MPLLVTGARHHTTHCASVYRTTPHHISHFTSPRMQLPIRHYNMKFCMELERRYAEGSHIVTYSRCDVRRDSRAPQHPGGGVRVHLDLMVEVTDRGNGASEVQKVVRVPNHIDVMDCLRETPHLLHEFSSRNGV